MSQKIANFTIGNQWIMAKKTIKVFTGTDIPFCTPSHPLSVVLQIKNVIDRIARSSESEFQYNCNSPDGIMMFELYGHKLNGLDVQYYINGTQVKFEDVLADFARASEKAGEIIFSQNKDRKL